MKQLRTVVFLLISLGLIGCGGERRLPNTPPLNSVSPVNAAEKTAPVQEITLKEALAELEALPVSEGVDTSVFSELKSALADALRAKGVSKLASKPPTGEANRVDDLTLDGTLTLAWSYRNVGDYNQDSIVSVSDLTPLAVHFRESASPENEWIDGNVDTVIDIKDITPIAIHFFTDCAGYSIRGASMYPGGTFSEIGTAGFPLAGGDDRKSFAVGLPESEYRYFAVAPFDYNGELGELSNVVYLYLPPPNQPPVADLIADPASGNAPLEVVFDASASIDPDGEIVSYEWDFDGDGTYDGTTTEPANVYTYESPGIYESALRVTDGDGAPDTDSVTITVNVAENELPIADLVAYPTEGNASLEVNFDASGSYDPDGTIAQYDYDWEGDGVYDWIDAYDSVSYTYNDAGEYNPTVRVTDDDGAQDTANVSITVNEAGGGRGDWWMFGREPTHNRRSPYVGPQTATLQWRYETGDVVYSSPAIGEDGTVYVGSRDKYLYALNPDGTLKWRYQTGNLVDSSPAIGEDGTIYVGSWDYCLHAINPDGTPKWQYQTESIVYSSPAIGADGTIYVGGWDHYLYAINSDGTLQWRYETGDAVFSSPAIGADGTIYVGSYDTYLYALTPDGDLKWRYQTEDLVESSSPAIAEDGTVYVGSWDNHLHAINPDGSLKWKCETGDGVFSPAIGEDGTVYVGSRDKYLYALNPDDGTLNWRYETGGHVFPSSAIGADGTIYVGNWDNCFYAINSDGTLNWRYETESYIFSSPAIAEDGTVYVGSYDNYLYAFHD